MDDILTRWRAGQLFDEHFSGATEPKLAAVARKIRERITIPDAVAERLRAVGHGWHLLVLSADWCADAVSSLPWVDALCSAAPNVAMRILDRDANLDLMDTHLTNGRSRSIPVVILYDAAGIEQGWWGPRPRALQAWVMSPEAQAMPAPARFAEQRKWYTQDEGRSILAELTELIEQAAARRDGAARHTA